MKKLIIITLVLMVAGIAFAGDITTEAKRVSYGKELTALQNQANSRCDSLMQAIVALNKLKTAMQADTKTFTSTDIALVDTTKTAIVKKLSTAFDLDPTFKTAVKTEISKITTAE